MNNEKLNPEQIEVVKTYFEALAFFRDEEYLDPDDDLLSSAVESYCNIMTYGGGDPVKLAARFVFGEESIDLKLI